MVPAAVPSLVHSSQPVAFWQYEKNRVPLKFVRCHEVLESKFSGSSHQRKFVSRTVPAGVPSLLQSSLEVPSHAVKKRSFIGNMSSKRASAAGSVTRTVPSLVPSLTQSCVS
jgi:hypothetical protein